MKKVTLRHELEALNLYLGIEQLRFGDRLRLEFEVDEAAAAGAGAVADPAAAGREFAQVRRGAARGGRPAAHHRAARAATQLKLVVADDGPGPAGGRRTRRGPRGRIPQHARAARRAVRRAPDARRALRPAGPAPRDHVAVRDGPWSHDDPRHHRGRRAAGPPRARTAPARCARHRDRPPVRQRPRGARRDRGAAARPHVPRHPDARARRASTCSSRCRRRACRCSCSSRRSIASRSTRSRRTRSTTC